MPTPLGHGIIGLALYGGAARTPGQKLKLTLSGTALAFAASYIPDLDFIPGIVIRDHFAFHHGPSHSLLFGLIADFRFTS